MDIHSSADGVLVTIHDDTVDRTTDGTGRVTDLTLAELKSLDAGSYWTEDGGATYPYRGQGVTIATLEEVFAAFPDRRMVIEIKQEEPSIVEPFCALIAAYGMTDKVLVASFLQPVIDGFRAECPSVATSAARTDTIKFYLLQLLRLQNLVTPSYEAFQVPEQFAGIKVLTPHFIKAAQQRGVRVEVWTVNDSADMSRFLRQGVDGIITDRPDLMRQVLQATSD
jgi:glycerophosphoryl diester phosphodiesterase